MEKKTLTIKEQSELDNITADSITLSASEVSYYKSLDRVIKNLTAELDAWKDAVKEKYNHQTVKGKSVNLTIIDRMDFNKKAFEQAEPELFNQFKTLPVHQERVSF